MRGLRVSSNINGCLNYRDTLRLATKEEKEWLLVCEKENKFIEFNEINNYINKETKFEKGRWYKMGNNWISKFSHLKDNQFWGENINTISKYHDKSGWLSFKENEPILITNLSEIQEFLPTNHPDKIVKQEEKWKVGNKVRFKSKSSENARYFKKGIDNLAIKTINEKGSGYDCKIWESDKSDSWDVMFDELELIPNNSSVNTFNFEKGKYYRADYEDKITYFVYSKIVGNILYTNGWRWSTETTFNDGREDISTYYLDRIKNPIIVTEQEAKGLPKQELSLLEQAKLKFPIGTKYFCAVLGNPTVYEITKEDEFKLGTDNKCVYTYRNGAIYHSLHDTIKWAEIVKQEDNSIPDFSPEIWYNP